MAKPLKILFVTSEAVPFAKVGGLADVSASLPKALVGRGHDVRVLMPFYKCVKNTGLQFKMVARSVKHRLSGNILGFNLLETDSEGVKFYFLENNRYFDRENVYGPVGGDYVDNALRFGFLDKAVFPTLSAVNFEPDIIHCNDWQTGLIPLYLKFSEHGRIFKNVKTLFTIHNLAYQGIFEKFYMYMLKIPQQLFRIEGVEYYGNINFMKSGILYSDAINTVSKKYSEEIMTEDFGAGMEGVLKTREKDLSGIPNGVDYDIWSPEKDKQIKVNYNRDTLALKSECKKDLMGYFGVTFDEERPVLGYVGRFVHQKGIDLLSGIIDRLVELNVFIVILGSGQERYNAVFKAAAEKYPAHVRVCHEFNDELSHKIEAGCDIFLMPSRYEPCGLNQMYSVKYGTIPVVHATGGLDDAIVDFGDDPKNGNGFKFAPPGTEAFLRGIKRALAVYSDKDAWKRLMQQAMSYDFSWQHSAGEYETLYRKMLL
ncbi:MAG: glycogen synthase GlgA [Candidatus Omnitrophica bacterium]|nr:glycogen synthase GlgA [Candidatus Omnitrophota bacterium]